MVSVHQFVHSFVAHDAISTHTRHLRRLLTEMGIPNEIWVSEKQSNKDGGRPFEQFVTDSTPEQTVIMYHLSTNSPMPDFLQHRPERLVIDYHNVTPAEMFSPWEPHVGVGLEVARKQLTQLASSTELAIGDSAYNAAECAEVGYAKTTVAPILFDPRDFERVFDKRLDTDLSTEKAGGGSNWLFVGRIAPNKCQHDIIRAFAAYRQLFDDKARLHLVGGSSSHHYLTVLKRYVNGLGLADAVNITGGVSNGALAAYYRNADVFVSLSEHEGFGVPLLEAMHNRLPIVAFAAAAVPETVGNAALLVGDKSPAYVATLVDRVLRDEALQSQLQALGQQHLAGFTLSAAEDRWRVVIEDLVRTP